MDVYVAHAKSESLVVTRERKLVRTIVKRSAEQARETLQQSLSRTLALGMPRTKDQT